ncbi:MAG: pyruvate synthase subunit PorB [archaeon]|nr:pyruvate synthase subunit PorB [archaeon]
MTDFYKDDLLAPGHKTCAGCGPAIAVRQMLKVIGKNVVFCNATGCIEVTTSQYPLTSWKIPWIHVTFENAASVASGIREALDAQGKEDVHVVAIGGDGGMVDIGFRAFSGALERGHNILVICYDNEAYMNTGVQRSGATPWHASTSTTPAGKISKGKEQWKKDVPAIAQAHHIPYVATASIGYPKDLERKIKKALSIKGPKYIHIHTPCPVGWNFDTSKTIEIAKDAVESKMWALFEIEDGKKTLTHKPKGIPVSKYVKAQKRFKHLSDKDIEEYQRQIDSSFKEKFNI